MKTPLWTALLLGATHAFVLVPAHPRLMARVARETNNEALERLQQDFHEMQDRLLDDLAHDKRVSAEEVVQEMLEKAASVTAVQRYMAQDRLEEARMKHERAADDRQRASLWREKAHQDALGAEHEVELVESMNAAYEDLERVRDLSVAHAAHELEEGAKDLEIESTFRDLEAIAQMESAEEALIQLKVNEEHLKESLKQLREMKSDKAVKDWVAAKHHKMHKWFLDRLQEAMHDINDSYESG